MKPCITRGAGRVRRPALTALALAAATLLGACAPLVLGGAVVGSALVVTDRRTSGTQIEDEAIELKASSRFDERLGGRGHIVTTSYNRVVLLTGQVPTAGDKVLAEQVAAGIDNVRSVVNELAVAGNSSLITRSGDSLVTGRVKTRFFEAKDLMANSMKVVTESGTVYLMGRVTEREAARATDIARSTRGVQKVVRVFDLLTEAELAALPPAANSAGKTAPPPATPTTPPGEPGSR